LAVFSEGLTAFKTRCLHEFIFGSIYIFLLQPHCIHTNLSIQEEIGENPLNSAIEGPAVEFLTPKLSFGRWFSRLKKKRTVKTL